jgi:hypothetical protein
MFIKLAFTASKTPAQIFRVLTDVINTQTITSISALNARASSANYATDLLQNLDSTNSYIIRTDNPSNTIAHISRPAVASANYAFRVTVRQPVYDAPSTYAYTQFYSTATTTTNNLTTQSGTAITGGAMTDTQWDITTSTTQTSAQGTTLTLSGATSTGFSLSITNLYTFYFYINDSCMLFTYDTNASGSAPFSVTVSASLGTFLAAGQYTRYDYWNTNANGIVPLVQTNGTTGLFGKTSDYSSIINPMSTTTTECMLRTVQLINGNTGTGSTWSILTNQQVVHGLGTRYCDFYALVSNALGAAANAVAYGPVIFLGSTTANIQSRIPTNNLSTRGYIFYPLVFRNSYYNMLGGNITEQSKFYIYHGDYCIGDEVVYNNKTYSLWPVNAATTATTRIAVAVPKE